MRRVVFAVLLMAVVTAASDMQSSWTPTTWTTENTVELRTTDPGEEAHWFPVWVVTIDGDLYVRLGSRAAARFDRNTQKNIIGVRIAGKTFERVRGVIEPEKTAAVNAAMGEKYWWQGDFLVRYVSHPYTMRLEPEPSGAAAGP